MQNKPNSQPPKINATLPLAKSYDPNPPRPTRKNKPNQTQLVAAQPLAELDPPAKFPAHPIFQKVFPSVGTIRHPTRKMPNSVHSVNGLMPKSHCPPFRQIVYSCPCGESFLPFLRLPALIFCPLFSVPFVFSVAASSLRPVCHGTVKSPLK